MVALVKVVGLTTINALNIKHRRLNVKRTRQALQNKRLFTTIFVRRWKEPKRNGYKIGEKENEQRRI